VLKFAQTRLYLYNHLLSPGQDCVKAVVNTAYDCDLVTPGSLDHLVFPIDSQTCGAQFAVKAVLEEHCRTHHPHFDAPTVEATWTRVLKALESYQSANSLSHNRTAGSRPPVVECAKIAAANFDILLQELLRCCN
jgi:hypothetical protein